MKKIVMILLLSVMAFGSIGYVNELRGKAQITRNANTIDVKAGTRLYEKDIIKTFNKSKLRVMLNDATTITIGKDSILNIEEYLYDKEKETKSKPKTSFYFMQGSFKIITGQIGKINRDGFKLKTKTASMGIRGTTIVGNQDKIACTSGSITVSSAGKTIIVNSGMFTNTIKDKVPTSPKPFTSNEFKELDTFKKTKGPKNAKAKKEHKQTLANKHKKRLKQINSTTSTIVQNTPATIDPNSLYIDKTLDGFTVMNIAGELNSNPKVNNFSFAEKDGVMTGSNSDFTIDSSTIGSDYVDEDHFRVNIKETSIVIDGVSYTLQDSTGSFFQANPDLFIDGQRISKIDNESSWGYWSAQLEEIDNPTNTKLIPFNSTWIAGIKTPESIINTMINNKDVLNLSGHVLGRVILQTPNGLTSEDIKFDISNVTNIKLDLGNPAKTNITSNFTSAHTSWQVEINGATINTKSFSSIDSSFSGKAKQFQADGVTLVGVPRDITSDSSFDGTYYGTDSVKSVGGNFLFDATQNTKTLKASGVFKADVE
jgi:hypothetical protein